MQKKMAVRNEYTETVRDLQELLTREANEKRREALGKDLVAMAKELDTQRSSMIDLRVLTERVDNLKTLTWVLISALFGTIVTLGVELAKK